MFDLLLHFHLASAQYKQLFAFSPLSAYSLPYLTAPLLFRNLLTPLAVMHLCLCKGPSKGEVMLMSIFKGSAFGLQALSQPLTPYATTPIGLCTT